MWNEFTPYINGLLVKAGFLCTEPAYESTYPWPCGNGAWLDAYARFDSDSPEVPELQVRLSADEVLPLAITTIRPVRRSTGEGPSKEVLTDWYAEAVNPMPTDQIGERVRVYSAKASSGTETLSVQTLR